MKAAAVVPETRHAGQVVHLPLLHLVIPGDPVSQGNPQRFPNGGVAYPKATRTHRAYVEASLGAYWQAAQPIREPVILLAAFHFARPATHYGSGRNAGRVKDSAPIHHMQRPDADKLLRLVLDSLTTVGVWADDKLATRVVGEKFWSSTDSGPRTEITILRRDPMDITEGAHALLVKCPECGREVSFPIEVSGRHTCNGAHQGELDFTAEDDDEPVDA